MSVETSAQYVLVYNEITNKLVMAYQQMPDGWNGKKSHRSHVVVENEKVYAYASPSDPRMLLVDSGFRGSLKIVSLVGQKWKERTADEVNKAIPGLRLVV